MSTSSLEQLIEYCNKLLNSKSPFARPNKTLLRDLLEAISSLENKISTIGQNYSNLLAEKHKEESVLEQKLLKTQEKLNSRVGEEAKEKAQHNRQIEIARNTGRKDILNQLEDGILPDGVLGWRSTKNKDYQLDMIKVDIADRIIHGWKVSGKPEFAGYWWHSKFGYETMSPEERDLLIKDDEK